jgi:hypothetical protein
MVIPLPQGKGITALGDENRTLQVPGVQVSRRLVARAGCTVQVKAQRSEVVTGVVCKASGQGAHLYCKQRERSTLNVAATYLCLCDISFGYHSELLRTTSHVLLPLHSSPL